MAVPMVSQANVLLLVVEVKPWQKGAFQPPNQAYISLVHLAKGTYNNEFYFFSAVEWDTYFWQQPLRRWPAQTEASRAGLHTAVAGHSSSDSLSGWEMGASAGQNTVEIS